jgi:hypothetical protein
MLFAMFHQPTRLISPFSSQDARASRCLAQQSVSSAGQHHIFMLQAFVDKAY